MSSLNSGEKKGNDNTYHITCLYFTEGMFKILGMKNWNGSRNGELERQEWRIGNLEMGKVVIEN